ncbi:MAG: phospholipid-binding protein MlaC [Gammaproteobacteria bacterium]
MRKFLFLILCVFSTLSFAASSPVPELQATANKIVAELKSNQNQLATNPKIASNIVTQYLLPLADQQGMAQAALGRAAWKSATPTQRTEFVNQFRTLIVKTYAAAFSHFKDQKVEFLPLRGQLAAQNNITVQSKIISSQRPPVTVTYNLVNQGGHWKVRDFSVDGISMIQSFNSQFTSQLAQGGIAKLIETLKQHNAKV